MSHDDHRRRLRDRLAACYLDMRKRLEHIVGSREAAEDALHETWVRLGSAASTGRVDNPDAYLLRMATNIVTDQYRRERKTVHLDEQQLEQLLHIADELDDPARVVAGRNAVERLERVLAELPARRRDILLAARLDGLLNREIAQRWGISVSAVEKELGLAMTHCKTHLDELDEARGQTPVGRRRR